MNSAKQVMVTLKRSGSRWCDHQSRPRSGC